MGGRGLTPGLGWDFGEKNVASLLDVCFMWGKAVVYNLEWLRGNTPSSLCAETGGNNERLLDAWKPCKLRGFCLGWGKRIFRGAGSQRHPSWLLCTVPLERRGAVGGVGTVGLSV